MRRLLLIFVVVSFSGCGFFLSARVVSFHTFPSDQLGGTFVVVPVDSQKGSLEFKTYEDRIIAALHAKGFEPAPVEDAKYAVFLVYTIDSGRNVAYSFPIYGQPASTSATTSGIVNTQGKMATFSSTTTYRPSYGIVDTGIGTRTEFTRVVRLEILDKAALLNGQVKKIYEGEVVSSGSIGQLSVVIPTLLQALLQDFPGESGRSKSVTLPIR